MTENRNGNLYLVSAPRAFLYNGPGEGSERGEGPQTDEVFSGWAVTASGERRNGWIHIQTHYGYTGWMREESLRPLSREELEERQNGERFRIVTEAWADLTGEPRVQGTLLRTLPRGSIAEILPEPERDGWIPVRDAGGTEGWTHAAGLRPRPDDDRFLLEGEGNLNWFRGYGEKKIREKDEARLRRAVTESAMRWAGAPYRWGGKAADGIDCSGLAFMSWKENGILIWRDASIRPDYPVRSIGREDLREGDLVFFPGHVAVYIGGGKYIHATAYAKTPRVTVNSLNPEDPDYREDLDRKVEACGSLFAR